MIGIRRGQEGVALPLVRTPISSQQFVPGNWLPKSSVTVNRPLLTRVAALVTSKPRRRARRVSPRP